MAKHDKASLTQLGAMADGDLASVAVPATRKP